MRSPVKLFVGVLLLGSIAIAQQAPVKFQRSYKEGEKDNYRVTTTADTQLGAVEIFAEYQQVIKKVNSDGTIDVEALVDQPRVAIGGNQVPAELAGLKAEVVLFKLDENGVPEDTGAKNSVGRFIYSSFLYQAYLSGQEFEIGKPVYIYTVTSKDTNLSEVQFRDSSGKVLRSYAVSQKGPRRRVEGTITLDSVTGTSAVLKAKLSMAEDGAAQQATTDMKFTVATDTAKVQRIEGSLLNPPSGGAATGGVQLNRIDFKIERI